MGQGLRLIDIVLLNVVAVTSLRWIASAAASGPSSLVLWVLAAVLFFLPQGLAVAALSVRYPGEGGLYRWTKTAFGDNHGFVCGWCYWVNNLLYFPALLLYVSGNVAFALKSTSPDLDKNAWFVTGVTLGSLWLIAGFSMLGVKTGRWLQNIGAVANWIPAIVIVLLASVAVALYGSANPITFSTITPKLDGFANYSFFASLCFALAGLELVSFFEGDTAGPRRTIPVALAISGVIILAIYLTSTLGILVSVPQEQVTPVNGVLLPIQHVSEKLGIGWISAVCAALITMAGLGAILAWFSGAARVPYLVGVDRYLPPSFGRLHPKLGTPVNAILTQTAVASLLTVFATTGSVKLESAYKILCDMCLILYFVPYCYLFLAVPRLARESRATVLASRVGLVVTLIAIATTALPNGADIDWAGLGKTAFGTVVMLGLGLLILFRSKRGNREYAL